MEFVDSNLESINFFILSIASVIALSAWSSSTKKYEKKVVRNIYIIRISSIIVAIICFGFFYYSTEVNQKKLIKFKKDIAIKLLDMNKEICKINLSIESGNTDIDIKQYKDLNVQFAIQLERVREFGCLDELFTKVQIKDFSDNFPEVFV